MSLTFMSGVAGHTRKANHSENAIEEFPPLSRHDRFLSVDMTDWASDTAIAYLVLDPVEPDDWKRGAHLFGIKDCIPIYFGNRR